MTADPHSPPPVWYMLHAIFTYKISISYRYRNILAISYQYRIRIPKTNIVASLVGACQQAIYQRLGQRENEVKYRSLCDLPVTQPASK